MSFCQSVSIWLSLVWLTETRGFVYLNKIPVCSFALWESLVSYRSVVLWPWKKWPFIHHRMTDLCSMLDNSGSVNLKVVWPSISGHIILKSKLVGQAMTLKNGPKALSSKWIDSGLYSVTTPSARLKQLHKGGLSLIRGILPLKCETWSQPLAVS